MSFVHHYQGSQFKHQNVFRTISLGFQPFFPETQKYKMQLDTETFDPSAQQGYWKLGPVPWPSEADTRKIPWAIRQKSYDAQAPPGALETLNTYSRKDMALRAASQIDLGLESSKLAGELSQLIKGSLNNSNLARKWEISDTNELELTILGRDLEKVLLYGEIKSADPRSIRKTMSDSLNEVIPLGGQGMDLYFDEHLGLREGMKSVLKSSKQVSKSLGMEVSTAKAGTKRLSTGMNFKNLQDANEKFREHTEKEIALLNKELEKKMLDIYTKGPLQNTLDKSKKEVEMMTTRTLREEFSAGQQHTMSSFARRLLSRHHEVVAHQIVKYSAKDRFIEQVNLSGDYIGIVVLRGFMDYEKDPQIEKYLDVSYAVPQFTVEMARVVTGKSLSSVLFEWGVQSLQDVSKVSFLRTMDDIQQEAMDQASATPGRIEWLNRVKSAEFEISDIYGLSLAIGKANARPGEMGLTTTGIAKGLELKIRTVLSGAETKSRFAHFYNKMMNASNKLSTQWKSAVPVGLVHNASISKEWIFGDGEGNPHKKYLGIWGPTGRVGAAYDNWKDSERVEGENVSISPWLVSRRAGVASFPPS